MPMLDRYLTTLARLSRATLDSMITLETSDGPTDLVDGRGSLMTLIRVNGLMRYAGDADYAAMLDQNAANLAPLFHHAGHALQVFFRYDPDMTSAELIRLQRPARQAAAATGLAVDDILDERTKMLAPRLALESCYIALWSTPALLSTVARKLSERRRQNIRWPAPDAQNPSIAATELRPLHHSAREAVTQLLHDLAIKHEVLEVHDALRAIRLELYPHLPSDNFSACLPGDPTPRRAPSTDTALSELLWPPLRTQLATIGAERTGTTAITIGDRQYAAVDMTIAPRRPTTFPKLLAALQVGKTPFRASFLLEGGSPAALRLKQATARIMALTNGTSRLVADALAAHGTDALQETWCRFKVSAATWAPRDQPDTLVKRQAELVHALEGWGECGAAGDAGDPLEAVMSSALGLHHISTATDGLFPLRDVLTMLPLQRPASPWDEGSAVFLTPDGRPFPLKLGASNQKTWINTFTGTPGRGKSMLASSTNIALALSGGSAKLPYIAIIDIGPTSKGTIDLIRERLPPHRRHEALHVQLQMTPEYAVNIFDLPLGLRTPLPDHRALLEQVLLDLVTSPGQQPHDRMSALVQLVIDELYALYTDATARARPKPYHGGISDPVDTALRQHAISLPADPIWWEVVDALFEAGDHHAAGLAQRYAVPTLNDAPMAARSARITQLAENTTLPGSSESLIDAFIFGITAAATAYPNLAATTVFDIGPETRICAIDLNAVTKDGGPNQQRQASIMYTLAMHVTTRHWWLDETAAEIAPPRYEQYYRSRVIELKQLLKHLLADEYRRCAPGSGFHRALDHMSREGRKWNVILSIATQLWSDLSQVLRTTATNVFLCGADGVETELKAMEPDLRLSATAKHVFRQHLNGPRPGIGAPFLLRISTDTGAYEHWLFSVLGATEIWAVTTTAVPDVALRTIVTGRLGSEAALTALATLYPGGSAKQDYEARIARAGEAGHHGDGASNDVIKDMAARIVAHAESALEQQLRAALNPPRATR